MEKRKSEGADLITKVTEPVAPDAAKNSCIKKTPREVPLVRNALKNEGNIVAPATVITEISGSACISCSVLHM